MDRLKVFVSIVPQQYFLQQIGQDLLDVQVMVQPGANPAHYEPKPKQMADLAKTRVYFAIGVPFEKAWLNKIAATNPHMKIVHTDRGIKKLPMASHRHDNEKNGHDGPSSPSQGDKPLQQSIPDPHIWLSPPLVKIQAGTVLAALNTIDPSHEKNYQANFNGFILKIDELDRELKKAFSGCRGLQFMVFHPSWGYFAHHYGLEQMPVEIDGKEPKPAQLKDLIEHARKRGVKVIFAQPQFSTKSADLIAREINGQVIMADPLAGDWLTNLREVADQFKAALK
jgi:zinc transport system substrate-binding protein